MQEYLSSLISEQINRALSLKKLIPHPIVFPELLGLAERCTRMLGDLISTLESLKSELEAGGDTRDIFRDFRTCVRELSTVEYYGIPALYYQTPEVGFLNKLMYKIYQEVRLPFPNPCVCCTSNEYYYSFPPTNTVFLPLAEAEFLLHIPDMYHELGHYVITNMEDELRLKDVRDSFSSAVSKINDHYIEVMRGKARENGPPEILMMIERIHNNWEHWIQEFFCDLFALYTLGPAYAWSHLHLTTKVSKDIHVLTVPLKQTHPSDESRMRLLLEGMKLIGFDKEATEIKTRWDEVTGFWGQPSALYQYAYPNALLREISVILLDGIRKSGFSIASRVNHKDVNQGEIRSLLNEAWTKYWNSPYSTFRQWEEGQIKDLRNGVSRNQVLPPN